MIDTVQTTLLKIITTKIINSFYILKVYVCNDCEYICG